MQANRHDPFDVRIAPNAEAGSVAAARLVTDEIRRNPDLLICSATGNSPSRMYQLLAKEARRQPDRFDRLRLLKLDEWCGLDSNHTGSCEHYLRSHLVEPLGMGPDRFNGFQCRPLDADAECRRIQEWLESHGPIGLCVLGLGLNGHLGLIEPADCLATECHVAELAPSTRRHAMLKDAETIPTLGMTIGMKDILQSREVLLLIFGENKREPLRRLLSEGVRTTFPASFLRLHPNVTLVCDEPAAALLEGANTKKERSTPALIDRGSQSQTTDSKHHARTD